MVPSCHPFTNSCGGPAKVIEGQIISEVRHSIPSIAIGRQTPVIFDVPSISGLYWVYGWGAGRKIQTGGNPRERRAQRWGLTELGATLAHLHFGCVDVEKLVAKKTVNRH